MQLSLKQHGSDPADDNLTHRGLVTPYGTWWHQAIT